ncbi:MAG: flagellar biosynthesis anti-sigma factor FlgM [Ramlibacter sp.]|nr:flagellar biosynthesis anti-sigma factor FlgM [Ramlibacter sp.]
MKIGPPIDPKAAQASEGAARSQQSHRAGGAQDTAAATSAAPVAATGDQVKLSQAATQLGAAPSADFDAAKVAEIQDAIRQGRFQINAGAIADRLIADATALVAPPGRH